MEHDSVVYGRRDARPMAFTAILGCLADFVGSTGDENLPMNPIRATARYTRIQPKVVQDADMHQTWSQKNQASGHLTPILSSTELDSVEQTLLKTVSCFGFLDQG